VPLRQGSGWKAEKFIHSDKDWLAYRLRQMAPAHDVEQLLDGLADTFEEWIGQALAGH
jgi:hypothetical protein